jgi:hypothetical protein
MALECDGDFDAVGGLDEGHRKCFVTQLACLMAGGVHVPSMIDGGFSLGQYSRNIKMN